MDHTVISSPNIPKEQTSCCSKDNCHEKQKSSETQTKVVSSCCSKPTCHNEHTMIEQKKIDQSNNCSKHDCHKEKNLLESKTKKEHGCCSKPICEKDQVTAEPNHKVHTSCCSKPSCKNEAVPIENKYKVKSSCCDKDSCHNHSSHAHSNDEVLQISESKLSSNSERLVFKIEGMCCASEIGPLKEAINPLIQGKDATLSFDLINSKAIIEFRKKNNIHLIKNEIIAAVAKTGMRAKLWTDHVKDSKQKSYWERHGRRIMNILSAIGLIIGFIIQATKDGARSILGGVEDEVTERAAYPHVGVIVSYSFCIITGVWFILPKALLAIKRMKPNTKLLTVIATAGAIAINEWFEAALSMYLFSAAELLEAWNMERARKSIKKLMELAPATAQVLNENGTVTEKPVEEVSIGATILIKPGEKIPMDSELLSEFTTVNQAPITGESLPIQKETGDSLFAGTINGDIAIKCKVTKKACDSTLASIIRKIEEAQSNRSNTDQWIENFAMYYVPLMMVVSILVMIIPPLVSDENWYTWIYKGLEILVISCPCSLIISTPVSIVAGITAAARSGVLIKGGIHLENAAALQAFAMDKTGTITTGEPVVHSIISLDGTTSEKELLALAMALEVHSDHPLARAIQRKAKTDGINYESADQFRIFRGKGAEGYIQGKLYWIGSHRFLHEKIGDKESQDLHKKIMDMESLGQSIVSIGHDLEIYGLIGIADAVRGQSKSAIQAIKRAGVQHVVMLTGDSKGAAKVIADSVKIDEYQAELLPEDKVKKVEELVKKYKKTAMVGDGVNDAPAMAASMLGIAMGTAGSDTAIETADIALMADDLGKLAWLITHARRVLTIIKQNVAFSLMLKILFAALTFANKSTLWLAIVADMGATFIVVSNSLRLVKAQHNGNKSGKYEQTQNDDNTRVETISGPNFVCQSKLVHKHQNCHSEKCKKDLEAGMCSPIEKTSSEKNCCVGSKSQTSKVLIPA